ncbi:MAG: hypothetical protein AAB850_01615 [Patescibacteria group bacterium]
MRSFTIVAFILVVFFGAPLLVSAQQNTAQDSVSPRNTGQNITLINPLNSGSCAPNENCLLNFLNKILEFVIRIGTVVVILMLVYVGYLFVVAQGSDTKITEARKALLWTIVGALILVGSQAISKAIEATVQALSVGQ